MAVENFRLVSPVEAIERRDMPLNDRTLLNPNNANPLIDGEWLEWNNTNKAIRSGGDRLSWALFAERGRTDTQAIGKAPVLYLGSYEADTLIFDGTGLTGGNALMIDDVTIATLTKSGLKLHSGGAELVVGYVIRLPATNGLKLRFMQTLT